MAGNELQQSSSSHDTATLIYALYFVALFTGVPFFIGAILAYIARDGASPAARSHYDHQIDIFWRVFIGGILICAFAIVSSILVVVLIGIVGLLIAGLAALYLWLWTLVRSIRGVQRSSRGEGYTGPSGWAL